MIAELKEALTRSVADLLHHYDCGLLRLPQVRRYLPKSDATDSASESYADDATIDRLCGEIRGLGEELFTRGGVAAMGDAIAELDARASRAVDTLWHDIGGAWFA